MQFLWYYECLQIHNIFKIVCGIIGSIIVQTLEEVAVSIFFHWVMGNVLWLTFLPGSYAGVISSKKQI